MRAAGMVLAVAIATPSAGLALGQEVEGTSSVGVPAMGEIAASKFGSSLWVRVSCPGGGPDCSGEVSARSLNPRRFLDSLPFTVPTASSERLRIPIKGSAYNKLRRTGKLRVTVDMTSLAGVSDSRTLTVKARKKKTRRR